jgi:amino acid transporter
MLNGEKSKSTHFLLVMTFHLALLAYSLTRFFSAHHFLFLATVFAFFCLMFLGFGLAAQARLDWSKQSSRFVSACRIAIMVCCSLFVFCMTLAAIAHTFHL